MIRKNIFKLMALALLMPAMMMLTACGNEDEVVNPEKPATTEAAETAVNKGYALPVTVNVTRQDDGTRAEFNKNGDNKLAFSTGDKLFVNGFHDEAGRFAGELTWQSGGTFSGTIYTEERTYAPIEDILKNGDAVATLLPAGYESYGYLTINENYILEKNDDYISDSDSKAFVASENAKANGVEQLSFEQATGYDNGFTLVPQNAVLNFTITGLEAGEKDVTLNVKSKFDKDYTVTGSVTPNGSGVATFAIGVPNGAIIKDMENNLTVGSSNFTLPSTALTAGKIYNITRGTGATVDLSTKNAAYTAQNGETLTGTLASNVKISIADGATVILNGVTINGTKSDDYLWAGINCEGDATIILSGTNSVKGFHQYHPGIRVLVDKTLTINGTGVLNASSNGDGSGIGGGYTIPCGNIVIEDGTIIATGEFRCAGIGGGTNACGYINITGGTVTAQGGVCGAGIGSGQSCECGYITISGGTITAQGGGGGAGIGSGAFNYARCGDITITSGVTKVTATMGEYGTNSIGAGTEGYCGTVTIGGTEYAGGITTSPYTYPEP